MANLTVHQPSIKILKVEMNHGLSIERSENGNPEDWIQSESSFMQVPMTYYTPAEDKRDWIDGIDTDAKPYSVCVTALIESPMKLFVQNQNFSKILLGSDNGEMAKNVVRFETNLSWYQAIDPLGLSGNAPRGWKITDFNNLMNENPHF